MESEMAPFGVKVCWPVPSAGGCRIEKLTFAGCDYGDG